MYCPDVTKDDRSSILSSSRAHHTCKLHRSIAKRFLRQVGNEEKAIKVIIERAWIHLVHHCSFSNIIKQRCNNTDRISKCSEGFFNLCLDLRNAVPYARNSRSTKLCSSSSMAKSSEVSHDSNSSLDNDALIIATSTIFVDFMLLFRG